MTLETFQWTFLGSEGAGPPHCSHLPSVSFEIVPYLNIYLHTSCNLENFALVQSFK